MGIRKPGELAAAVEGLREDQRPENLYDAEAGVQLAVVDQVDVLLEAVQPLVVADFIRSFVYTNSFEYPEQDGHLTEETVGAFLEGLDLLRQPPKPTKTAVDEELRRQTSTVLAVLAGMKTLPWSGDHLYGDALSDAQEVLRAVLAGQDWPVLERFRCPSISKETGLQCQKQLPHDSDHSHDVPGGNGLRWTDEASTNPPKAYDSDAEERSGHPVRRCRSIWADHQCEQFDGHEDPHTGNGGSISWPQSYATGTLVAPLPDSRLCAASRTTAGLVQRCGLYAGHTGDHQDDGSMARWS